MAEKFFTKALQFGLGIYDITREQAEKVVKEVTKNQEVNRKKGRKMVHKLLQDADKATKKLERKIDRQIKKFLREAPLVTKKDLARLEKKVNALAKKVKNG